MALLVLVLFVLPAEYGVDPTGIGARTGILRLAEPAADDAPAAAPSGALTTFATFRGSFPLTTSDPVLEEAGYLAEGETLLLPFTIPLTNVSEVVLRIEFADRNATPAGQRTRPDTFEIELKSPTGDVSGGVLARSDATSGGGRGEAVYVVRPPPAPREVEATSAAGAREAILLADPADPGLGGEWRARVTLVEAGDAEAADGSGLPLAAGPVADTGNDWAIEVVVRTWSLAVEEKPGTRQRADKVVLDLAPGQELEYKLRMSQGERLDYRWTTDGPEIYVDFHGERDGDASGAATRHRAGSFTTDEGTLLAPFDGRHGWFWRNTSPEPARIALDTRGAYEVIGVV